MHRFALLTVAVTLLAACGPEDGAPTDGGDATEPVLVARNEAFHDLPSITVAEALTVDDGEQVVVAGALFVDADGVVRLCGAIAESFPPQCGGDRIVVEGLDLAGVGGLQQADGVQWVESIWVLGSIRR
ncbi:MAG TPA: hypothetical protein VMM85_00780 [Methylomirabilota bacterium]|nr:hypothetical protein [Methylomirabilota bacterium]